jgi:hypothetical protein
VAHRKLGEYATQAEELATVRERNRLARELHDSYLTVIHVHLEAALSHVDGDRNGELYVAANGGIYRVRTASAVPSGSPGLLALFGLLLFVAALAAKTRATRPRAT